MFRLATVPQFAGRQVARLAPVARTAPTATERLAQPATADVRIRRFADGSVSEDTYSALLPGERRSPIDLLRLITDACKDLPEFQIRSEADEQFILKLTLKS